MEISGKLYKRLIEGIDSGVSQALQRNKKQPVSFVHEDPKTVNVPKEQTAYSKHDKLFYWLSDFVVGNFQDFKSCGDYSKLSDEDARNLCQIFRGVNSEDIQKIIDDYRLFDFLEP